MKIPVKGYPNLYRDDQTGAIINCDSTAYDQYIIAKNRKNSQRQEIDELKKDVGEIKSILQEILNESRRNKT
ncbi:hypothetical protein EB169_10485 [archaeon]|nr:hypothetical protein [archaeon]|tara:strand:- start:138 stop:353 length:216 start_codon:yes stop_codon:yes gene_type:complete